jgi:ribosomal protein L37AE/L43A
MIDHGDRLKRTVCDICDRPFNPKRIIPVPNICRDCRDTFNRPAYPPQLDGDAAAP